MSLLSKATKQVSKSKLSRNAVVEVLRYELNPEGTLQDQILVARDIDNGNEIRIAMGPAPTETAAAQRTNIVHLAKDRKKMAAVGGFVKVDGLRLANNGLYEAKFVKTLKSSPDDSQRHFFKMKARAYPALTNEKSVYGSNLVSHYAKLELLDETVVKSVSTSSEFKNTVYQMLKNGSQFTSGMGDNTVFLRDSAFAKIFALRAVQIKEASGVYRKPNEAELKSQIEKMEMVKVLSEALDADESAAVDLMPGASHLVVGKTASGKEYATQAEKFFTGTFSVMDGETGELNLNKASGFREAIVGMTHHVNDAGEGRWFVNNVSATLSDVLTLNGLAENSHVRPQNNTGHADSQGPGVQQAQNAPAAARSAPTTQPQYEQSTMPPSPAPQQTLAPSQQPTYTPVETPSSSQQLQTPPKAFVDNQPPIDQFDEMIDPNDQSLDDLLDQDASMDDDLVARAAAAYEGMEQ